MCVCVKWDGKGHRRLKVRVGSLHLESMPSTIRTRIGSIAYRRATSLKLIASSWMTMAWAKNWTA